MELSKIHDYLWEIPKQGAMLVPGRVYANARMIDDLRDDPALTQVANVACMPGIVGYSLAMPDIHWGYGFAIGGVAAMDADAGVISPGGVGYDINCGVRLVRTNLQYKDVLPHVLRLADALFDAIPAGVGSKGAAIPDLSIEELRRLRRMRDESHQGQEEGGCDLYDELAQLGVTVRAQSRVGVAEEMPAAYKDVADVVEVMEAAGVTQRVARLKPFAVIKG